MPAQKLRNDLVLGVLELSPVPLSAKLIAANFDADSNRAAECLENLEASGLVQAVEDGYYSPTTEGSSRVLTRGTSAA